ncbi:MAG: hypothetical protein V3569_01750 [Acholeplasmataceae bacterium]|nr:hypothetical protein [Acholeplasmataceae bacterium]
MKKTKQNISWFGLILMILILLLLAGIILYVYFEEKISQTNFFILMGLVILMGVPIRLQIKQKIRLKEPIDSEAFKINENYGNNIINDKDEENIYKQDVHIPKEKQPIRWVNIIPIFVLAFVFIWMFIGNPLDFIFKADPIGKWYYDMEVNDVNLTEYWYIEMYEDGTLSVGIKNSGYPEDPEGSGTWEMEGQVLYVYINYDYSGLPDQNLEFKIQGNKLYDLNGVYSGYEKDTR